MGPVNNFLRSINLKPLKVEPIVTWVYIIFWVNFYLSIVLSSWYLCCRDEAHRAKRVKTN